MTDILLGIIKTGLIQKLDGNDERFAKMQAASIALAEHFSKQPALLIPAILAALDTKVSATEPLLVQAQDALLSKWPMVDTVFPDPSIMLLRAILFDACQRACNGSNGNNGAILWLTAVDTLPYSRLGKEQTAVKQMMCSLAEAMEKNILDAASSQGQGIDVVEIESGELAGKYKPFVVDRPDLHDRIGAAFGPHNKQNEHFEKPNPNWSNQGAAWCWEAAQCLHVAIADELDALAESVFEQQCESQKMLQTEFESFHSKVQAAIQQSLSKTSTEKLQLNTLWWFEALYSPSLRMSYRELNVRLAAVVMAFDLLTVCNTLLPASVAYVLAEAVARLPDAAYNRPLRLLDLISELSKLKTELPENWLATLSPAPRKGRFSLRDLAVCALGESEADATKLLERAALPLDTEISLPQFARAIFRQEQALRLAKGA